MSFLESSYSNYRFPATSSTTSDNQDRFNSRNIPLDFSNNASSSTSTLNYRSETPRLLSTSETTEGGRQYHRFGVDSQPHFLPSSPPQQSRNQLNLDSQVATPTSSKNNKPLLELKLPRARKKTAPKPPAQERGKRKPVDRRIHNASERIRRENLNIRFQKLGRLLPSLEKVSNPSKPLIVNAALSFAEKALENELTIRQGMEALSTENELLLNMLNQERQKSGLEPIVSRFMAEMPPKLSEFGLGEGDENGTLGGNEQESQLDGEEEFSSLSSNSDFDFQYDHEGTESMQAFLRSRTFSEPQLERSSISSNLHHQHQNQHNQKLANRNDWETSSSQSQSQFSPHDLSELSTPIASHFQQTPTTSVSSSSSTTFYPCSHDSDFINAPIINGQFFSSPHSFDPEELNQYATHRRRTIAVTQYHQDYPHHKYQ